MGRSIVAGGDKSLLERLPAPFSLFDQDAGQFFEVQRKEGMLYQSQYAVAQDGKEVFRQTWPLAFAVGAGAGFALGTAVPGTTLSVGGSMLKSRSSLPAGQGASWYTTSPPSAAHFQTAEVAASARSAASAVNKSRVSSRTGMAALPTDRKRLT
jgi:hypothetical protein